MKISVNQAVLLAAITKTKGIVDNKTTSNVLAHVLIEASANSLRITATDYDVTVISELAAEVLAQGSACINGKSLASVLKGLDAGDVTLELLPSCWCLLKQGRSEFKLAGVSAADFPEVKVPHVANWMKIPRVTLSDLLDKTAFSMSTDETRMNLNGVFFKIDAGAEKGLARLTAASTDGHRLSLAETTIEPEGDALLGVSAILHKKGVDEIQRVLADTTVEIGFAQGVAVFRSGATTLVVRQIEDAYPDFTRVIPTSFKQSVSVSRDRLLRAVRRVAMFSSNKTYLVRLRVEKSDGLDMGARVIVGTSNPDYGEGRDELDADRQGDNAAIGIGFNFHYLVDVLSCLKGERVTLGLTSEESPAVVTSPSEPGATFVIMPMRV